MAQEHLRFSVKDEGISKPERHEGRHDGRRYDAAEIAKGMSHKGENSHDGDMMDGEYGPEEEVSTPLIMITEKLIDEMKKGYDEPARASKIAMCLKQFFRTCYYEMEMEEKD
ncbi:hypothetical protein LCGC14_2863140 [marine sediment metagenome]|uniref:Uncharacterized protein n=1 Tax=marine sediment metagenome TaxID=412755 RepID=A0A0F8Y5D0_9ZZZZ